jgi:hypothetical protein
LTVARLGLFGRVAERLHLALATHELRVTTGRPALQASAQLPQPGHFVDFQWLAHSFNASRSQRLQREITFNQLANGLADSDRTRHRERLKSSSNPG